jgi:hypothetical protein
MTSSSGSNDGAKWALMAATAGAGLMTGSLAFVSAVDVRAFLKHVSVAADESNSGGSEKEKEKKKKGRRSISIGGKEEEEKKKRWSTSSSSGKEEEEKKKRWSTSSSSGKEEEEKKKRWSTSSSSGKEEEDKKKRWSISISGKEKEEEEACERTKKKFQVWWSCGRDWMVPLIATTTLAHVWAFRMTKHMTWLCGGCLLCAIGPYTACIMGEEIEALRKGDAGEVQAASRRFCALHHVRLGLSALGFGMSLLALANFEKTPTHNSMYSIAQRTVGNSLSGKDKKL